MTIEDDIHAAMDRTEKDLVEHTKDILRSHLPDGRQTDSYRSSHPMSSHFPTFPLNQCFFGFRNKRFVSKGNHVIVLINTQSKRLIDTYLLISFKNISQLFWIEAITLKYLKPIPVMTVFCLHIKASSINGDRIFARTIV